jgi:chromosome segregation ATPase
MSMEHIQQLEQQLRTLEDYVELLHNDHEATERETAALRQRVERLEDFLVEMQLRLHNRSRLETHEKTILASIRAILKSTGGGGTGPY